MRTLVALLMAAAALLITATALRDWVLYTPVALDSPQVILIARGSSEQRIAQDLMQRGIVPAWKFRVASRITRSNGVLRSGEYSLRPGMDLAALLDVLRSGKTVSYTIRFIEGTRFADWREQLGAEKRLTDTLSALSDAEVMDQMAEPGVSPEGMFFPDTYQFSRGDTDLSVLRRARARMRATLAQHWQARAAQVPLATAYEALILASIIEKESGYEPDRPIISSVFHNRLVQGMKLQSDPTVVYGLKDYDGNITRADLKTEHAYNTYMITALPPTPISMPGESSIAAAVAPATSNYRYFVARGDGSSEFSVTLDAHNAAVRRYQKTRRAGYRSAPQ